MTDLPKLDSLIPNHLEPRAHRIFLDALEVEADIGFHEFEVGRPQRLLVSVSIWLEADAFSSSDDPNSAWNYDFLRNEIIAMATERRFNLQETLARKIYRRFAAMAGVRGLKVALAKPDIYADAQGVGVEISSFDC